MQRRRRPRFIERLSAGALRVLLPSVLLAACAADGDSAPQQRSAATVPDFSGTYNIATLTPVQRPRAFGDKLFLTEAEAEQLIAADRALADADALASDPNREAPPTGGDGSEGAAGNVGGYNQFWIDNGDSVIEVDGKFRTSIITDPANGRRPEFTPAGLAAWRKLVASFRDNDGTAWWHPGPGPYDNPEQRPLAERCLLGFGSTSGPPMFPVLYNNLKRIVQTPDHIMILNEMVHDARIIRLNAQHAPTEERSLMGDSIGWFEDDVLVVETTNFRDHNALRATTALRVIERFEKRAEGGLMYRFTVTDPNTWTRSWGGEYPWPSSTDRVYEYACHEANYALGNILRGARRLEAEAAAP
ncbi:MAG: hypothetical protein AAF515_15730 [Pseudomonadota bacterium]